MIRSITVTLLVGLLASWLWPRREEGEPLTFREVMRRPMVVPRVPNEAVPRH